MEIKVRNVTDGLERGLSYLLQYGVEEPSRNGPVLAAPEPVTITYKRPKERVLFSPLRNANPFFHLMESLWMLAGEDRLKFPLQFNSRFKEYSDDGVKINGAYGHRWRRYFYKDQLDMAVAELLANPASRRVVIGMWDPAYDLGSASKDIPCNTHIYVDARGGELNITVCNRRNDALWGCFGANAVHMSVLQEYLALRIGIPVGVYRQFTNNLHIYTDVLSREAAMRLHMDLHGQQLYSELREDLMVPLFKQGEHEAFSMDLTILVTYGTTPYSTEFFLGVVQPMQIAWHYRKEPFGLHVAKSISAEDWRVACAEWLTRYQEKRNG